MAATKMQNLTQKKTNCKQQKLNRGAERAEGGGRRGGRGRGGVEEEAEEASKCWRGGREEYGRERELEGRKVRQERC